MNNLTDEEWQAWYALTPQERWCHSMKLWEIYLAMGGSLDPNTTRRVLSTTTTIQTDRPPTNLGMSM